MAYRALYRTFRPAVFSDLVGQEVIATTLRNALRRQRLAHAYLFCGPRGTGKTSTAKILAKAVNCLDLQDGEPCGVCANCLAIAEDRMIDVVEIDAASNRGIDDIRELKEQVRFVPSMGKRKVYIIDEVHMLTTEAFNALLKTLEEPPSHALFVLATTDPQKIPPTVASRAQRFDFKRIPPSTIAARLRHIAKCENITADDEALSLIARSAAGGLRDAVSLLDQAMSFTDGTIAEQDVQLLLGTVSDAALCRMLNALVDRNAEVLFGEVQTALDDGADAKALLRSLAAYLRRLFLLKVGPTRRTVTAQDASLAEAFTTAQFEDFLRAVNEALVDMRFAPDGELVLEVAMIDLWLASQRDGRSDACRPSDRLSRPVSPPRPTMVETTAAPAAPPSADASPLQEKPKEIPQKPLGQEMAHDPSPTTFSDETPPSMTLSIGDLPEIMAQVMVRLRKESIRLHAFMKPASLQSLKDGVATVSFPADNEFHYKQINQREHLTILGDCFSKTIGSPVQVQVTIAQKPNPDETLLATTERLFGKENVYLIDDD